MELKKIHVTKPKQKDSMLAMESMMNRYPPSFHTDAKQIPEIKSWEVGKVYRMVVDVEMKSKSESEHGHVSGGFNILAYKPTKTKTIDEMDDHEFGEYQGKELGKH